MIKIVQRRKIWFAFSLILTVASVFALVKWNLKMGIDFTGGTLMELNFKNEILNSEEIKGSLKELNLGDINVQFSDEKNVLLRLKDIDEETHQKIIEALEVKTKEKVDKKAIDNNIEENKDVKEKDVSNDNEPISGIRKALAADEAEVISEINKTEENGIEVATDSGEKINVESEEINSEPAVASSEEKNIEEKRFDSIGPVIGNELKSTAVWAIVIALIGMVLYIGWAFRKVSRPVSSFKYGIIATIALFHDVVITLGVFSILGYLYNIEIGLPFVAAILAILGYSVNDTIVVFDRTRENLIKAGSENFEDTVNKSVNETLIRSLNASFTTLLVLFALFLFGGETIKYFIAALIIGIAFGTYSSIFIASPLLVTLQKWSLRKNK
jgi:preprotein translocase subunit SecF